MTVTPPVHTGGHDTAPTPTGQPARSRRAGGDRAVPGRRDQPVDLTDLPAHTSLGAEVEQARQAVSRWINATARAAAAGVATWEPAPYRKENHV